MSLTILESLTTIILVMRILGHQYFQDYVTMTRDTKRKRGSTNCICVPINKH